MSSITYESARERLDELFGLGKIGAELEGTGGSGERVLILAETGMNGGAGIGDRGVIRVRRFTMAEGGDGGLGLIHAAPSQPEIVPSAGVSGIQFYGGFKRRDDLGRGAGFTQGEGEFVGILGIFWIEASGFLEGT